jgi:hypothetical protein
MISTCNPVRILAIVDWEQAGGTQIIGNTVIPFLLAGMSMNGDENSSTNSYVHACKNLRSSRNTQWQWVLRNFEFRANKGSLCGSEPYQPMHCYHRIKIATWDKSGAKTHLPYPA